MDPQVENEASKKLFLKNFVLNHTPLHVQGDAGHPD
jgi:hypothetical protein